MLFILLSLDDGPGAVILVAIINPGSVIVLIFYPADYEGSGAVVVVSAVIDGSGAVFSIVVVDEGAKNTVVEITVTVV